MKKQVRFEKQLRDNLYGWTTTFIPVDNLSQLPITLFTEAELENKWGRGFLEERRGLLKDTLDRLEARNRCNPQAVHDALVRARVTWGVKKSEGQLIDKRRELFSERDLILKNVRRWLAKLRRFLTVPGHDVDIEVLEHIEKLTTALKDDFVMTLAEIGSRRRPSTNSPRPWLRQARAALKDAGVPKDLQSDLLRAIGILPYRPS